MDWTDWTGGLDWTDWTGGLDWWTGLVDWTGRLTFFVLKLLLCSLMRPGSSLGLAMMHVMVDKPGLCVD